MTHNRQHPAHPRPRVRRPLTAGVVLVATAALTGCGVGGGQAGGPPTSPVLVTPRSGDAGGAAAELSDVKCAADAKGSWSYSATVRNTQQTAQKYVVTVGVLSTKNWKTVKEKKTTVTVAPGKTATVKAGDFYTAKSAKGLQCQTRMVRAPA